MKHFKIEIKFDSGRILSVGIEAKDKRTALKILNKAFKKESFRVVDIYEE